MGLFSKSEVCCICNENKGSKKIQEGQICKQCLQMCSIPFQIKVNKLTTKQMILDAIEENNNYKEKLKTFNATKKIGKFIEFDDNTKQILIKDKLENKLLEYKDIVEYELLVDDDESITKGGLGRAVVGGVLFGGVGAVVGGITDKKKSKTVINSLKVKITINNINKPDIYINLVTSQLKANSILYKVAANEAQEIISTLAIISKSNDIKENTNSNVSVADELIKLKGLLEDGILSQEEFDIEKNKLLNK